jgi:hypothetical protein
MAPARKGIRLPDSFLSTLMERKVKKMDAQLTNMLEGWKTLESKGKEAMLSHLQFLVEEQRPDYQKRKHNELEDHRFQMAKVRSFKYRLEKVAVEARALIFKSLEDVKMKRADFNVELLKGAYVDLELLNFFVWAAEYKPFYLLEEEGLAWKMAERTRKRLVGRIGRMKGKPA